MEIEKEWEYEVWHGGSESKWDDVNPMSTRPRFRMLGLLVSPTSILI